jgi:hypothetical protein
MWLVSQLKAQRTQRKAASPTPCDKHPARCRYARGCREDIMQDFASIGGRLPLASAWVSGEHKAGQMPAEKLGPVAVSRVHRRRGAEAAMLKA